MLHIPYGSTTMQFDETLCNVICSGISKLTADKPGIEIVKEAMNNPIDSPCLTELAKGKKTCCIIISDHTRPVPSKDILPNMLDELLAANNQMEITLLVATGFHRPTTTEELESKLGKDIMSRCKIHVHDCRDKDANVMIGTLPSGAPLIIDKIAAETELLISEGFIEPHFFAGYSGGRKSVLPGICDEKTVLGNHCSKFIDSEFARTGILENNPIHTDMVAAAKMAKLKYIVNVIIDEDKKTVAAFAGDFESAHEKGCSYLEKYACVKPKYGDIVITSNGGAPLDQNIYQCVKCMTAAEATCKENGTIIVCAECKDGHGGEGFYNSLKNCKNAESLYNEIMNTTQAETIPDQWETQILARILKKHRVIMVTEPKNENMVCEMKMEYADSIETALSMARTNTNEIVTVIPNGISVIIKP